MDLLTAGVGLYREACITSCDGNEIIKVKDENVTDTQEDVDLLPAIKSENDSHMDLLKSESGLCEETCLTSCHDRRVLIKSKDENVTDTEEDDDLMPETLSPMKTEHESHMCLLTPGASSYRETCLTPCHDGNEVIKVKVEDVTDVEVGDDPLSVTFPVSKTEHKSHMNLLTPGTSSYRETCLTPCHDGNEVIKVKIEDVTDVEVGDDPLFVEVGDDPLSVEVGDDPLSVTFPVTKTEHKVERPYCTDMYHKSFNRSFSQRSNLKIHQLRHNYIHSDRHPYSCDMCNKSFIQKKSLKIHLRIHSGECPYTCDVCNKPFHRQDGLRVHQRIHNGDRRYSCDVCNKSFGKLSNLKVHQRIHSGERPYTCNVCNESFSRHDKLKVHKEIHSGRRAYSCDVCNKTFSYSRNLKIHQRIHSGEYPYTCDLCGKSFRSKQTIKNHQRTHSGEHSTSCDLCNKSFSGYMGLRVHQRVHSGVC